MRNVARRGRVGARVRLVRLERASQEGDMWADMSPEGHEINQVDIWENQLIAHGPWCRSSARVQKMPARACTGWAGKGEKH